MGHGITYLDRYGEVRKNGQRAWHGLGKEIEEGMSAVDGFTEIGLGWETVLAPVYAKVPKVDLDANWILGNDGQPEMQYIELTSVEDGATAPSAHMKVPTPDELKYRQLGMVSETYRKFDNLELAMFADALAGADAAVSIETAGSLYGGRRIFALVKLPNVIRVSANDTLDQYVLVSNGHGGYAAFACYPTAIRVCCANTLRWSERDASKGLKFRHVGNWEEKVAQARVALGIAFAETEKFEEQVKFLRTTNMSAAAMSGFMLRIYNKCFGNPERAGLTEDAREKMMAKRTAVLDRWGALLAHPTNLVDGMQGTAWATYNAISWWQDHERGRFTDIDFSDGRIASNIYGVSAKQKRTTFENLLATASKPSGLK